MAPQQPQLMPLTPEISATGALSAQDIDSLAQLGVRVIVNNRPDGEDPGQLPAAEARRLAETHGITYHHIPVTGPSLSRADVDAFAAVLKAAEGPVVAHCRSGTRSTLLWALTRLHEGDDAAALVAKGEANGVDISALPMVAARIG